MFQRTLKEALADNEWKETLFRLEDNILSLASNGDCVGIFYMLPIRFQLSSDITLVHLRYFEHGSLEGIMQNELLNFVRNIFSDSVFPMKIFNSWDVTAHKKHLEQRKCKEGNEISNSSYFKGMVKNS